MGREISFLVIAILLMMMMTQLSLVDKVVNQTESNYFEYVVGR